jgi:putative ABC transport system permease protein
MKSFVMVRISLKSAWRNITRNKGFSTINIAGLALGMAASLLIFLWVRDERSIGSQYKNADHLYRVMEHEYSAGKIVTDEDTPGLLADELKKQFSEVVYAAGFSEPGNHVLRAGEKITKQAGCHAGEDWFKLYDIPLLAGHPTTALNAPVNLAISRRLAESYFGSPQAAMGKTIEFDNRAEYQVTAVFENLPANAPEKYDFLLSWSDYLAHNPWLKDWTNGGPRTRLQLRPDADPAKFNEKMKWFLKGRNTDFGSTFYINLFIQPEKEAYLYSGFKNGIREGGRIQYVRLLSIVAIFLLLIAGINYMNLATARSVKRAREVGVRKVVGANRSALIRQFMGEALLLTTLALLLAVLIVIIVLPAFNHLTGKQLSLSFTKPYEWVSLALLLLAMTGLAGSYPALFLSSLKPVRILKGALRFGAGANIFRRGLVVFQFMMSVILIVGTVVIYHQLQYIQNKSLGFDRSNLITIAGEGKLPGKYSLFKQQLLQMPGIEAVTHGSLNILRNGSTTESVEWPGKDPNITTSFNQASVGYDFQKVFKVRLLQGRDFDAVFASDSSNYLVNEVAAKSMGYTDPVGKPLTFWRKPGTIVGLVEDFHFNSLHSAITPIIIRLNESSNFQNIVIRTKPGQTKQAIASLQNLHAKMNPEVPFSYSFIDTRYQQLYKNESVLSILSMVFSSLAIFIACLGLLGLAAFTAERRTREIGVRKVLGATVIGIVTLLSKDFLKLVLLSIVIAIPIAWWTMHQWLQDFAYKTGVQWWFFVVAGGLAIVIALLTIGFQSIKAAIVNPAKSLKAE